MPAVTAISQRRNKLTMPAVTGGGGKITISQRRNKLTMPAVTGGGKRTISQRRNK